MFPDHNCSINWNLLIKDSFPVISCSVSIKTHSDLLLIVLFCGKSRKIVLRKIIKSRGFDVLLELASYCGAKHKHFANSISIYRKIVFCSVLNGDNAFCDNIQSSLFFYFLDRVFADGNIHIAPTTRQRPTSVVLANKKDFIIFEYGGTCVKFWCLVSCFIAKQIFYRFNWDV